MRKKTKTKKGTDSAQPVTRTAAERFASMLKMLFYFLKPIIERPQWEGPLEGDIARAQIGERGAYSIAQVLKTIMPLARDVAAPLEALLGEEIAQINAKSERTLGEAVQKARDAELRKVQTARIAAANKAVKTRHARPTTARERHPMNAANKRKAARTARVAASVSKAKRSTRLDASVVDSRVLDLRDGPFTIGVLMTKLDISRTAAASSLKRLLRQGQLKMQGQGRFASYTVTQAALPLEEKAAKKASESAPASRKQAKQEQAEADARVEAMVLGKLGSRAKGFTHAEALEALPGVAPQGRIIGAINRLVKAGKLSKDGGLYKTKFEIVNDDADEEDIDAAAAE